MLLGGLGSDLAMGPVLSEGFRRFSEECWRRIPDLGCAALGAMMNGSACRDSSGKGRDGRDGSNE